MLTHSRLIEGQGSLDFCSDDPCHQGHTMTLVCFSMEKQTFDLVRYAVLFMRDFIS